MGKLGKGYAIIHLKLRQMKSRIYNILNIIWKSITYKFDRLASGSILRKFLTLITVFLLLYLVWLFVFTFCVSGHDKMINKDIPSRHWSIIAQMIDPGNQHMIADDTVSVNVLPTELSKVVVDTTSNKKTPTIVKTVKIDNTLRWLVLLISISGTLVFSGLLISTFTNIFEQRVTIVRQGLMNYYYEKHLVIIGCNKIVVGLINQLLKKPEYNKSKIVILTSQNVQEVKQLLVSKLPAKGISRIQILSGNRTCKEDLNRLWLPQAKVAFILGENNEDDHDSLNTACLAKMEEILCDYYLNDYTRLKHYPQILDCNILFDSQTTYTAHQFLNFQKLDTEGRRKDTPLNINVFSFYEKWTQKVFVGCKHCEILYSPLDFEPIDYNSNKYVHVVVGGITRMGFAVGLQAARLGHFANFERKKTRITFIDSNAEREMNFFATRFQNFYDAVDVTFIDLLNGRSNFKEGTLPFIDVELTFINGHFESPELREKLMTWTSDPDALTTIAICFNNPSVCLAAGLYLPNDIYSKKVRVIVQQETEHSILSSLHPDKSKVDNRYENVTPFGMVDDCIDLNLHSDFKAKAVNYFYSSGNSLPKGFSTQWISIGKV